MIRLRTLAFLCFVLSGAASISYQLLWLRDAISHFGVITPVISVLLSVFMLGLALGTYAAGCFVARLPIKSTLRYYAGVELFIAVFALCVRYIFNAGYHYLLSFGSLTGSSYFIVSALVISLALLPACVLIGTTMPLMMRILEGEQDKHKNFSILYFANLHGAILGCVLPLLLIEILGLHQALAATTLLNLMAALLAVMFSLRKEGGVDAKEATTPTEPALTIGKIRSQYKIFLFLTGFAAIGSEVLWVKAFTPVTSSSVYSFALVLMVYLVSNTIGNYRYLNKPLSDRRYVGALLVLPLSALLPIIGISTFGLDYARQLIIFSITPICFLFGYLTPQIIDKASDGNPTLAARAYIYNFAGCILGPLITGYLLFPAIGLKWSFLLHACLLALATAVMLGEVKYKEKSMAVLIFVTIAALSLLFPNYEDFARKNGLLFRDYIGYEAAFDKGMARRLTVNGIGMTLLTTITKNMIYLPDAFQASPPHRALIICFGMGTTLRAATKLPLDSITIVELSSGVVKTFPYFHSDAHEVLADPRVHVVTDDGRRYLLRNPEKYDIIAIDPPPPVSASGSGLLYSSDFIAVIASRLNDGGILSHWMPEDNKTFLTSTILSAIKKNFKYVKVFHSVDGWGIHILASNQPFSPLTPDEYLSRLPDPAKEDLKEYFPAGTTLETIAQKSLREDTRWQNVSPDNTPAISDNHLYNEFFALRSLLHHLVN